MIWRPFGQSGLRPVLRPVTAQRRCMSIASILALPSLGPDQTPRAIEVTGHVRTVRNQKRWSFVELGDGSTIQSLQALLEPSQAVRLGTGTAVTIAGSWRPCPMGTEQSHELHAESVRIVGAADAEAYPIQKKYHSAEYLRTLPHLRLRTPFNALLARLRSDCEFYISTFYREKELVRVTPPLITSSDCEGAGEVFTLKTTDSGEGAGEKQVSTTDEEFFRSSKYLTVSSQLHLEAFVHEHRGVWTLSPTFRAEKSDTPRHLSEFWMLEAEIRTESLTKVMDLVEDTIRSLTTKVHNSQVGSELRDVNHTTTNSESMSNRREVVERRWLGLRRTDWPRITYTKAIELLQAAVDAGNIKFQHRPEWNYGFHLEHEKYIAAEIGQGSPVFVTDYPQVCKPFYMLPSDIEDANAQKGEKTVACFDLLLPEACEVVGGSLREHRLEPLSASLNNHGIQPTSLNWYLDLRRYGSVPHGGFGLGFDRLLGYLAGVDNVRDVVPWPRYYGRCDG